MGPDLAVLLAQVRGPVIQVWAERLATRLPAARSGDDFAFRLLDAVADYLRRDDAAGLRAAVPAILDQAGGADLPDLLHAVTLLRDVVTAALEERVQERAALQAMTRRLTAAVDLVLVEAARHRGGPPAAPARPGLDDAVRHLETECRRAARYQRPVALLLVEVDQYPADLQRYGESLGELRVAGVEEILARHTREVDARYRIEGGTFVVILPEIGPEQGASVAERIRTAVEERRIIGEGHLMIPEVTVSIGGAVFPVHAQTVADLLDAAREALTEAILLGRNTVVVRAATASNHPAR